MSIHITLTHTLHIEGTARLKLYHQVHGVEILTDRLRTLKNDWLPTALSLLEGMVLYVHIWRSYQDRQTPGNYY